MPAIVPARDRLNTRTVYLAELNTALQHKRPYNIRAFSTLNQKLGILQNVSPGMQYPEVKYFAIGSGGHGFVGTSDAARIVYYQHDPSDAALYNQIPFVLRTLDNDLLPIDREKYCLRKEITIGSKFYIAYYLRRIDMQRTQYVTHYRKIQNAVVTETEFITTEANLSPAKNTPSTDLVNITSGDFLVTTTRLSLVLSASDVQELMNVFEILYGNQDYARISEIAICSGMDYTIQVTSSTGQFNFLDAIAVQVMSFIGEDRALRFNTQGWSRDIDVGSNIPMRRLAV